jgi:DnaJ-class molecular chaperone
LKNDQSVRLGRAASHEEIDTAYREARAKYDEDLVAHLGDEVRMHFKLKAEAVEEAYRTLSRSIPAERL